MQNIILRIVLQCLLFGSTHTQIFAQEAKAILGFWKDNANPDKQVEMYEQGGRYFGRSTPSAPKPGFLVFHDLVWNASTKSYQGYIQDPEGSGRYPIVITWSGSNAFQFKVKRLVFTKSFRFVRITQ